MRIVREYERGVIFRLGRLQGPKGPGLFFIIPLVDRMVKVNLQTVTLDIKPQNVITKDNVTVRVNAVTYFNVVGEHEFWEVFGEGVDPVEELTKRGDVYRGGASVAGEEPETVETSEHVAHVAVGHRGDPKADVVHELEQGSAIPTISS